MTLPSRATESEQNEILLNYIFTGDTQGVIRAESVFRGPSHHLSLGSLDIEIYYWTDVNSWRRNVFMTKVKEVGFWVRLGGAACFGSFLRMWGSN